jgi:hypothetical protein
LPRKISKLCDNALIRAFSLETQTVSKAMIDEIAAEVRLTEEFDAPRKKASKAPKAAASS